MVSVFIVNVMWIMVMVRLFFFSVVLWYVVMMVLSVNSIISSSKMLRVNFVIMSFMWRLWWWCRNVFMYRKRKIARFV